MPSAPICPRCGQPAVKVILSSGRHRNRCCGLWSAGDKPLRDEVGHRAAWELKSARREAHTHFDRLWKEGRLEREAAYVRLAQELGIERDACHMSSMDAEIAKRVPAVVKEIWTSLTHTKGS
ncbi:hypothetical protein G3T14_20225 [Methylobacterium sp. BTF04]|nr:hypothetical protein [Methylobacterium sp. BTF04]